MFRFRYKIFNILLLILFIGYMNSEFPVKGQVLGAKSFAEESFEGGFVEHDIEVETETAFDQKEIQEYEAIPFSTRYEENDDVEYGTEEVLEPGVEGTKTYTYLLTYWIDEEIDKKLIDTKVDSPIEEVISKGTKIVWRLHSTPDVGRVKYWYKMRVWATKYDANCIGCTGRTYSGTEVHKGVCATDPRVIPLGTNFYVEGYGLCRAEDIGGAIKGDKIDLGYVDASKGEWRTGYTDIYLLTNPPY
jgi:3D (Asp-Asp-Asp) domain-containing protein